MARTKPEPIQIEPLSLGGLPPLVSFEEAQWQLGRVSRKVIYAMIERGQLRSVMVGGRRMIRTADILAIIEGTSPENS